MSTPLSQRRRWTTAPLLLAGLLPLAHLSAGFAADQPAPPPEKAAPAPVAVPEIDKVAGVENVLPAPTEPLKDFQGKSLIVLDLPPTQSTTRLENGEPAFDPGISLWLDLRQSFVWPDRVLIERSGQVVERPDQSLQNVHNRDEDGAAFEKLLFQFAVGSCQPLVKIGAAVRRRLRNDDVPF